MGSGGTGGGPDDAISHHKAWWAASGKGVAEDEWPALRTIRSGDTSLNEELEIESSDGTRKVILHPAISISDQAGRVAGAIMVHHDITERKRFEDQLRSMVDRDPLTSAYNRRSLYEFLNTRKSSRAAPRRFTLRDHV
jgi:hypothetical protein